MMKTVNITAAQLNSLHTNPVTLVSGPGPGKAILVTDFTFEYKFNTTPLGRRDDSESNTDWITIFYGNSGINALRNGIATNVSEVHSNLSAAGAGTNGPFHITDILDTPIILSSIKDFNNTGSLNTVSIVNPGSSYAVGDTGHIDNPSGDANSSGSYQVTSIGSGGSVTGLNITNGGYWFLTGQLYPTGVFTGAGDATLTMNAISVTPGDSTGVVNIFYTVISV